MGEFVPTNFTSTKSCRGKIDQIGRVLVLEGKGAGREGEMKEFYGAVGKWASSSRNLFRSVAKV